MRRIAALMSKVRNPKARAPKGRGDGRKLRTQYAALPFACEPDGDLRILLVTSRETKRWVIPKGWPMKRLGPDGTAAREAYEEAGLVGEVSGEPIGVYTYEKRLKRRGSVMCEVQVYPLRVERQLDTWPERAERQVQWFSPAEAAEAVAERELGELILGLNDNGFSPCTIQPREALAEA
jgi:8-oxo-dGTP pyrophosphatase MutT (NUDIX family)